jgi:hypothetical protein
MTKIRLGFVTNSSSTSFIICNKSKHTLSVVDFVRENPQLIEEYVKQYDWNKGDPEFTQENLLKSAEENNGDLTPGENHVTFGDESGTLIGRVFDYILRDGGSSKNFDWCFYEYNR